MAARLTVDTIDDAVRIFHEPARYAEMADVNLALPDWFELEIDPHSDRYRAQVMRLWREITRREIYDPVVDELTDGVAESDALLRPAFYATGDASAAGEHLMALAHFMLKSGVTSGSRIIEYGAGFAQNALAFARLGAHVDTVDISPAFCAAVSKIAERYQVNLTAHNEVFGYNPAGHDEAYDLILFYESFHHCFEFGEVIPKLYDMLKPNGRVMLAGEPIVRGVSGLMPFPWGIRLDWMNVAIMRERGWMELGFEESFFVNEFRRAGFLWRFHPDPHVPHRAQIHEFSRWQEPLELSTAMMTQEEAATWYGAEYDGRWSMAESRIGLPAHEGVVEVTIQNRHAVPRRGSLSLGKTTMPFTLAPEERKTLRLRSSRPALSVLTIRSNTTIASDIDSREVGVYVERITPT